MIRKSLPLLTFSVTFALSAGAQNLPPTYIPQTHANAGQDVVPSYDGWIHNPDGSFNLVFGYMNRNYQEELAIPAGPDNRIEPGPVDQGQPTYFLPRRHAWMFQVRVPADFAQKEVVWTITSHGRTEKAYASLQMEWEIIPRIIMSRGNLNPGLDDPNKPPVISIAPVGAAAVGAPLALSALVTDDGLPKPFVPKPRPEVGGAQAPGIAQTNSAGGRPRIGLNVTWMQLRGPAKAAFGRTEPVVVAAGKADNTVKFSESGDYVLRATANDGELSTTADVSVTVPAK